MRQRERGDLREAGVVGERWILSTGGSLALDADGADVDPGAADFYDLLGWGGAESTVLPRRARSRDIVRSTRVK